jgi:parvulin-like peptidyl-prolyl isomerase
MLIDRYQRITIALLEYLEVYTPYIAEKGPLHHFENFINQTRFFHSGVATMAKKQRIKFENVAIVVLVIALIGIIGYAIVNLDKFVPKQEASDVEVTVNGDPIHASDIERRLTYFKANFGAEVTREFVVNQSVNELLLLQEAKKSGIVVDEAVINQSVNDWFAGVIEQMGEDNLRQYLGQFNISLEQYRSDTEDIYRKEYIVLTFLNQTVFDKLEMPVANTTVSEKDAKDYFEQNKDQFNQIDASHILICYNGTQYCTSNRTKAEALTLANDIYKQLTNNGDFASLAKKYSDDLTSGAKGGEIGAFSKDQMVPEFADAAFALKYPNQLTEPVESAFGYHIIKLNRRLTEFSDFQVAIAAQLQMQKQLEANQQIQDLQRVALNTYLDGIRAKADIKYIVNPNLAKNMTAEPGIQTFSVRDGEICREDGKPVVRMFSTTWCPHCEWVKETFDSTVKEYADKGLIVARHWQVDTEDDTLTSFKEDFMPLTEKAIFQDFNPNGGVPTFVFGCKYYRVGNGYESEKNLAAEKREFVAVIEKLLAE